METQPTDIDVVTQQLTTAKATLMGLQTKIANVINVNNNQSAAFEQLLDKWIGHIDDTKAAQQSDSPPTIENLMATFESLAADFILVKSIGLSDLPAAMAPVSSDGNSPASQAANNPLVTPIDPASIVPDEEQEAVSATPSAAAETTATPPPEEVAAPDTVSKTKSTNTNSTNTGSSDSSPDTVS
jgi:hypothetical protein